MKPEHDDKRDGQALAGVLTHPLFPISYLPFSQMLRQDPRNYQILFLLLFLLLGIGTRDWTIRPDLIGVVTVTCLLTQWVVTYICSKRQVPSLISCTGRLKPQLHKQNLPEFTLERSEGQVTKRPIFGESAQADLVYIAPEFYSEGLVQDVSSLKSAAITALGLSLLLRSDRYTTMILAGVLAILSKFIFQVQGKHFFNPANFGIISVLILTKDAWVSPGQWGDDSWYALLFAGMGGMILKRVGRWDTTAAFLGVYGLLEAVRNLWLGWTWDVFSHRLMSGSLLLFALFMLTDPRSIPNARIGRVVWAGCIALLTFILRNQFFMSTAVFWALFALAPLTVLLDYIWSSPRFTWNESLANRSSNSGEHELDREKEAIV